MTERHRLAREIRARDSSVLADLRGEISDLYPPIVVTRREPDPVERPAIEGKPDVDVVRNVEARSAGRQVARAYRVPDHMAGLPSSRWRRWWQTHVTRRP